MLLLVASSVLWSQDGSPWPTPLDAARDLKPVAAASLPEEYVWTAGEVAALRPDHDRFAWSRQDLRTEPQWFRKKFELARVPAAATIYVAGPRDAEVYLNGTLLEHFVEDVDAPIGIHVFHTDAARLLRAGENVVAIRAVRGRGIVSAGASAATAQLTYGEVLVVKLLAAGANRSGSMLLVSDGSWRSAAETRTVGEEWARPGFDDSGWKAVTSLGPLEASREFRQWSADAGMYAWPGYEGVSQPLGTYVLPPIAVTHVFPGRGMLAHVDALHGSAAAGAFMVQLPANATMLTDAESPSILLDFGREVAGRLLVNSAADADAVISVAYGESELEALATGLTPGQRGGNYLGTNLLEVPGRGEARGPKSAFRYVLVRFLRGGPTLAFTRIAAEGIAYPVTYAGSFVSSDSRLNRIWEVGAYTAHLCMQDDLWDAPKRDRGRWAGDIDVEGRVISEVFGDKALLEQTLAALGGNVGPAGVNGIPNYSALWLTSLASLYAHTGDLEFVRSQHEAVLGVVAGMDRSRDGSGAFLNGGHHWLFVDWSPGLFGLTAQAVVGTNLQYVRGYRAAAALLDAIGDAMAARQARSSADRMEAALPTLPRSPILPAHDWQLGTLAAEVREPLPAAEREALWQNTFSHVAQLQPDDPVISPYFNASVLDAMARLGHAREALAWLREYWGGMLDEGATSFWESYDLRWPKDMPQLSLQADGTSGFFVSLAHGWSAGPAAWLMEDVLGVREPAEGYRRVTLAPRLLGLAWARGTVPTPHGVIAVDLRRDGDTVRLRVEVPHGVEQATLLLEAMRPGSSVWLDGVAMRSNKPEMKTQWSAGVHTAIYTPAEP